MSKKEDLYIMAAQAEAAEQVKKVEPVSTSEDIKALEFALETLPRRYPLLSDWEMACSPGRIRRLLDALSDMTLYRDRASKEVQMLEHIQGEVLKSHDAAQAKLSKAIDLLKETRDFYADTPLKREINAFLSQDSQT